MRGLIGLKEKSQESPLARLEDHEVKVAICGSIAAVGLHGGALQNNLGQRCPKKTLCGVWKMDGDISVHGRQKGYLYNNGR